ncbi:hypothetical protein Bca4012_025797 [Brassica carinata]
MSPGLLPGSMLIGLMAVPTLAATHTSTSSDASVASRTLTTPFYPIPEDFHSLGISLREVHTFGATFPRNKSVLQWPTIILDFHLTCLPIKEEVEPSMDEFVPYDIPVERGRSRSPKDKHVAKEGSDQDEPFCNFLYVQASGSGSEQGLLIMDEAFNASRLEARTAQFKAKTSEREVSRLKEEAAVNSLRERELAAEEARRAYMNGKKEVAEIVKNRFAQFSDDFGELKKDCTLREPLAILTTRKWPTSPSWALIPVSPDLEEVGVGVPCEDDEVNQPAAPSEVNDCSLGRSISGYNEPDP